MDQPLCPNCHERMSDVERGFGGVWSCLYCEGAWLPESQVRSLLASTQAILAASGERALAQQAWSVHDSLICPSCQTKSFRSPASLAAEVQVCGTCSGVFFRRGALAFLAPEAASPGREAPVLSLMLSTVTSALLLDPGPLVWALCRRESDENAP
jgi:Zn-finger nucleic acid-binding protein